MTLDKTNRSNLIKHKIEKAKSASHDVKILISTGMLHVAINRIYYGMFYALSALALKYKFETKKHQQLIGWFNKTFIKEKKLNTNTVK